MWQMLPYEERVPDRQYHNLIQLILDQGISAPTPQGVDALTVIGPPPFRFKPENGFPMITERNLSPKTSDNLPVTIWQQAIGEIFAFVGGALTVTELEQFGCHWWKHFATEEKCAKRNLPTGHLGPGSYGGGFAHFPTKDGSEMNQWRVVIEQAKKFPHLRTLLVTDWIPQYIPRGPGYTQGVVVAPCHGIVVHLRIINRKLTLTMVQRSADVIIGVPSNMIQYMALALALSQVLDLELAEFVHFLIDAHIYEDQLPTAQKILERDPRPFPTISLNPRRNDLFEFRREDFELSDYHPHPGIKNIPVSV